MDLNYINEDEFQEQDKNIQKVFKKYFDQDIMLYYSTSSDVTDYGTFYNCDDEIPLLTEGQLREFIEDKTDKTMDLRIKEWKYKTLVIEISLTDRNFDIFRKVYGRVINALWEVALEIAKEEV